MFVWNNYIRNLTFKSRRKHFEFRSTSAALRSPIKLALCGWISCKWILFAGNESENADGQQDIKALVVAWSCQVKSLQPRV